MCEILAPAGDKNSALAAINSGADAIYLGLKQFSARSSADNFDFAGLKEIADYASLFGVRVHVAMNTLVKQCELQGFIESIRQAWLAGADAIILQDLFLGRAVHKAWPEIVLHLSTQAGVCNEYGARLAKECGFSRVILAGETAFPDIAKIANLIETEVFVQGALCTCFSGQCYFSSFAGGNSGNRGRCKQPCRKLYSIDRSGFEERAYRLSPSDLCAGANILKLKEAGVSSFKIEGRMRRPEYVAAAVGHYRQLLSGGRGDLSALRRTYNRGNYTAGLAFGQDKSFLSSAVQGHIGEYVGTVRVVGGRFLCESAERPAEGDCFKVLRSGTELCGARFGGAAKGGFFVTAPKRLKNGDKLFITTDIRLNERLLARRRLRTVTVRARFAEGELPEAVIDGVKFVGDEVLARADNRPLSEEDIRACFAKVDGLPFEVHFGDIEVEGSPYLGMAKLNAFRRAAYEKYLDGVTDKHRSLPEGGPAIPAPIRGKNGKTAVICTSLCGVDADIGILKPANYAGDLSALVGGFTGEKYLYLPPFLSGEDIGIIRPSLPLFDGIFCEGISGVALARGLGLPLFAGVAYNAANTFAAAFLAEYARYYCISKELTASESYGLCAENAFSLACGGIKLMDLIYCPFGKSCRTCDRRGGYTLTDEAGRKFPLRRYEIASCRFEIYNCSNLLCGAAAGLLADFTVTGDLSADLGDGTALREALGAVTRGHSVKSVL